jgi:hypothetical protein
MGDTANWRQLADPADGELDSKLGSRNHLEGGAMLRRGPCYAFRADCASMGRSNVSG